MKVGDVLDEERNILSGISFIVTPETGFVFSSHPAHWPDLGESR
jgi:hypothetical protein